MGSVLDEDAECRRLTSEVRLANQCRGETGGHKNAVGLKQGLFIRHREDHGVRVGWRSLDKALASGVHYLGKLGTKGQVRADEDVVVGWAATCRG